jgi:hypothetical protein
MTRLLIEVRSGAARVIVPDAVLAQVWWGGHGKQARIAALLGLKAEHRDDILAVSPALAELIIDI